MSRAQSGEAKQLRLNQELYDLILNPDKFSSAQLRDRCSELLRQGADPNFTRDEVSVIAIAAMNLELEVMQMFYRKGVDVCAPDALGKTPLDYVEQMQEAKVGQKYIEMVKFLREAKERQERWEDLTGRVVMHCDNEQVFNEVRKRNNAAFLDDPRAEKRRQLIDAVCHGRVREAHELLSEKTIEIDPNFFLSNGMALLDFVLCSKNLNAERAQMVDVLIQGGAKVTEPRNGGYLGTAHLAAIMGDLKVMRVLCERGFDVCDAGDVGLSPFEVVTRGWGLVRRDGVISREAFRRLSQEQRELVKFLGKKEAEYQGGNLVAQPILYGAEDAEGIVLKVSSDEKIANDLQDRLPLGEVDILWFKHLLSIKLKQLVLKSRFNRELFVDLVEKGADQNFILRGESLIVAANKANRGEWIGFLSANHAVAGPELSENIVTEEKRRLIQSVIEAAAVCSVDSETGEVRVALIPSVGDVSSTPGTSAERWSQRGIAAKALQVLRGALRC